MKDNIVIKTLYRGRILYIVMLVFLLIGGILASVYNYKSKKMPYEKAGERFSDGAAQISVYFNSSAEIDNDRIEDFVYSIRKQMLNNGIEAKDDARQLIYTYAKECDVKLFAEPRTTEAHAYGVNKDFFYFNNCDLAAGSYFVEDNPATDVCIVTEETAFDLFGSTDVTGKIIYYEDSSLYIIGVIKNDYSKLAENAGYPKRSIFVLSDYFDEHFAQSNIFYFAYVCEEQYNGYALGLLEEPLGSIKDKYLAVNNTKRFSASAIYSRLQNFNTIAMSKNSIGLPWWENMARALEVSLMIILFFEIILLGIPMVVIFISILYMIWNKTYTFKDFLKFITKLFENITKKFRRIINEKIKKNS